MRKNLLETFDKVYILDLHGNAKKKEVCPDGSQDQNVFDIMQGVSINILVKTGNKKANQLGKVFHSDLYGKRDVKYPFLYDNAISSIKWEVLENKKPYFFFVPFDYESETLYKNGIKITDLFIKYSSGIETQRDLASISFSDEDALNNIEIFKNNTTEEIRQKLDLGKDGRDWKVVSAKNDLSNNNYKLMSINYRPFDFRKTIYTGNSKGIMAYPKHNNSKEYINSNLGLVFERISPKNPFTNLFISDTILDCHLLGTAHCKSFNAPLFIYSETTNQQSINQSTLRKPNLNQDIVSDIAKNLNLTFTNEKQDTKNTFAPIDILDYIYAVLHSPTYREKYKEFLKIDFPRVPYPKDVKTFWELVTLGGELRQIHLLESNKVEDYITSYEMAEDAENNHNEITTKIGKKDWAIIDKEKQLGRIWINESKYFDNVPVTAWEFYIGGYQPAQKWLKDRKERELKFEDILHYQKIIVALTETDRIMKEIDKIEIE